MGIWQRLRNRSWFWPPAFWMGLKWLFGLGDHPLVRIGEIALAFLPLFGVALVIRLNLDLFFAFLFALIFLLAIWAKGARLKWLADLARAQRIERPGISPTLQLPPVPHEVREEEGRTIIRPLTDEEAKGSKS